MLNCDTGNRRQRNNDGKTLSGKKNDGMKTLWVNARCPGKTSCVGFKTRGLGAKESTVGGVAALRVVIYFSVRLPKSTRQHHTHTHAYPLLPT